MTGLSYLSKSVALINSYFPEDPKISLRVLLCLLRILEKGETTTEDLTEGAGIPQPKVSVHTDKLRSRGLINAFRAGGSYGGLSYAPTEKGLALKAALKVLQEGDNEIT